MTRKITTPKTAADRRAEADQLHAAIAEQVEALRDSAAWARFLDFARAFHRYSIGNLLLILAQRPDATHVAGYRTWQAVNRQVRRGERGIRILGGRDQVTIDEDKAGEKTRTRRRVFFPVSVFDQSQTDLIDPDAGDPGELTQQLTGDDPTGILDAVADYLASEGWTLERQHLSGSANGYTTTDGTRLVVIDEDLAPAQAAKTALHEAAHVLLHADEEQADHVQHRGVYETEAESVAYIVAGILGLDTAGYSIGYVAGWSRCDLNVIKNSAARVLRAAHQVADAITESTPAAAPA